MKQQHAQHAKFRELNVWDNVFAHDHLSSQKWQTGTVFEQISPHSYPPMYPLQNQIPVSSLSTVHNPASPGYTDQQPTTPAGPISSGQALGETQVSTSEGSNSVDQTPLPTTSVMQRSICAVKPPQRLTEQT